MTLTIWHNPRCSKSRQTLAILEESGEPFEVRKYLDDAPTRAEIVAARAALDLPLIDLIRTGEKVYKELGLKGADEKVLLAAMAENPILIERPIVFKGDRARIGRPPEAVKELL